VRNPNESYAQSVTTKDGDQVKRGAGDACGRIRFISRRLSSDNGSMCVMWSIGGHATAVTIVASGAIACGTEPCVY
jgi:hypothetical protein